VGDLVIIRDKEGGQWEASHKGLIAAVLMDMIPGLSAEDAVDLTTDLIEDAMDCVATEIPTSL
jgi:hypothetical protein